MSGLFFKLNVDYFFTSRHLTSFIFIKNTDTQTTTLRENLH